MNRIHHFWKIKTADNLIRESYVNYLFIIYTSRGVLKHGLNSTTSVIKKELKLFINHNKFFDSYFDICMCQCRMFTLIWLYGEHLYDDLKVLSRFFIAVLLRKYITLHILDCFQFYNCFLFLDLSHIKVRVFVKQISYGNITFTFSL